MKSSSANTSQTQINVTGWKTISSSSIYGAPFTVRSDGKLLAFACEGTSTMSGNTKVDNVFPADYVPAITGTATTHYSNNTAKALYYANLRELTFYNMASDHAVFCEFVVPLASPKY